MYSGSNNIASVAWYYDNSSGSTHPVKCKAPNELGIYDMSGNVWEWCFDWKGDYTAMEQTNPEGREEGTERINRGGAWFSSERTCRLSNRNANLPNHKNMMLGFRIVLE
jgi:formylglycine-generating enzyme required for sulfatase activity